MNDYQLRVIAEKNELDGRLIRLGTFIDDNPLYSSLPEEEQERLKKQAAIMREYSDILRERIAAF